MTYMDQGTYGAKRQTWVGRSARAILQRMLEKHPNAQTSDLVDAMLPKLETEAIAREVLEYWIANTRRCLSRPQPQVGTSGDKEDKEEMNRRVAAAVENTKTAFLAAIMGSTFGDIAKMGPKFVRLGKMGKPSQYVSEVLSESTVLKVLNGK